MWRRAVLVVDSPALRDLLRIEWRRRLCGSTRGYDRQEEAHGNKNPTFHRPVPTFRPDHRSRTSCRHSPPRTGVQYPTSPKRRPLPTPVPHSCFQRPLFPWQRIDPWAAADNRSGCEQGRTDRRVPPKAEAIHGNARAVRRCRVEPARLHASFHVGVKQLPDVLNRRCLVSLLKDAAGDAAGGFIVMVAGVTLSTATRAGMDHDRVAGQVVDPEPGRKCGDGGAAVLRLCRRHHHAPSVSR